MSVVHANQICTCAVRANHDAHGRRLKSRVYTQALNVHFLHHQSFMYTQSVLHVFSSHVVASRMCSEVKLSCIVHTTVEIRSG